jgi:hypothetical protein
MIDEETLSKEAPDVEPQSISQSDDKGEIGFSTWVDVLHTSAVTRLTAHRPFAADVAAPSIPRILESLDSDSEMLRGFVVSVYVLGNAVGPV